MSCPGCGEKMQRRAFPRRPHGNVDLDLCFACHSIWFDQYESSALTPGAVIDLFGQIHDHHDQPPRPLRDGARCPGCRERLRHTHDIQRTNRISYYRCPNGHGRLTTFFQFLREKEFVRSITGPELARLKAHVKQVRCSSCGAPVDLARDPQCAYCRAPISILDPEAVRKTLAELGHAEARRHRVDPQAIIDGLLAGKRFEQQLARIEGRGGRGTGSAVDLVGEALDFLMSA